MQPEAVPFHKVPIPVSLTEAVGVVAPTVRQWVKENRAQAVIEVAAELILFADVINVKENINPEKSKRLAELLLDMPEAQGLNLSELRVFFREAFNFRYGQLYGGFGWNDLAVWLRAFLEERAIAKRANASAQPIPEPALKPQPEELLAQLYELIERLDEVPIVYPFGQLFELIKAKDPDGFRKWYLESADKVIARARAFGSREAMVARNVGEALRAENYKSDQYVDNEVKTEYVRNHARQYLETINNRKNQKNDA